MMGENQEIRHNMVNREKNEHTRDKRVGRWRKGLDKFLKTRVRRKIWNVRYRVALLQVDEQHQEMRKPIQA